MASLLLGPILRYVGDCEATVWVETDGPCRVEVLGTSEDTFSMDGHHYAIVGIRGLEPGSETPYEVTLDGDHAWPPPDYPHPAPMIRTVAPGDTQRIAFGSCRTTGPHEPPYTDRITEDERGRGIDALRTLGCELLRGDPDHWPHLLLMLGDQIYADDLSPRMLETVDSSQEPPDELSDFSDYAEAYKEAWSDEIVRWLLSTVAVGMLFDDHEISAEWKISLDWLKERRALGWYDQRISDGLSAYWIYQHAGNLAPDELDHDEVCRHIRSGAPLGPFLRQLAVESDRVPERYRWTWERDLGNAQVIAVDSRAERVLTPTERRMCHDGEWDWIEERIRAALERGAQHIVLASSVPFLMAEGIQYGEAWNEAVADGAWGARASRIAERIRQTAVLDHWGSFQDSFLRLCELLRGVATGTFGPAPLTMTLIAGDVHHCFLQQIGLPPGTGSQTSLWQAVCSPFRKDLEPHERKVMEFGHSWAGEMVGRGLAAAAGVPHPPLAWRTVEGPNYANHLGRLEFSTDAARCRMETTGNADWRDPRLELVFERSLLPGGPEPG
ncbi:MAG: alkaline phosphatase D family protein [Solirubrobacterales bacterium]